MSETRGRDVFELLVLLHDGSEVRFRGEGGRKVRYSSFKRSYFWVGIGGIEEYKL